MSSYSYVSKTLLLSSITLSLIGCKVELGETDLPPTPTKPDVTEPTVPEPEHSVASAQMNKLSKLDVMELGFPKLVSFRNESSLLYNVEDAKSYLTDLNGVIIKTFPWGQSEEYLAPSYKILDDYLAKEHPEKISLVQTIPQIMEFGDFVIPYMPHAQSYIYSDKYKELIGHAFDVDTTEFSLGDKVEKFDPDSIKGDEMAAILIREVAGELQWDEAEFISILSVNSETQTAVVRRNSPGIDRVNLTSDGDGDTVYFMSSGSKERGYLPNYSKLGNELSSSSKSVQQSIAEIFSTEFKADGKMRYRHGMALDVGWEKPKALQVGIGQFPAAEGILAENYTNDLDYTLGFYEYMHLQRELFGPDVLFTSDSNDGAQRATSILNGMESEGFSGHDDVDILNWSVPFNSLSYFKKARYQIHDANYVVMKDGKRGTDVPLKNRRLMFAGATALNSIVTAGLGYRAFDYEDRKCIKANADESCKIYSSETFNGEIEYSIERKIGINFDEAYGDESKLNWLGQPESGLLRVGFKSTNLFEGMSLNEIYTSYYVDKLNTISNYNRGNIELNSKKDPKIDFDLKNSELLPNEFSNRLKFNINFPDAVKSMSGDLLVRIQTDADARYGYDKKFGDVPRNLVCSPSNSNIDENSTASELYGYTGALKGNDVVFYWRNALIAGAEDSPTLVCSIDGRTTARITAISAYNSNDLIMREYEKGLIIVNPSLNGVEVSSEMLGDYFPSRTFTRIKGTHAAGDNLEVNTGAVVNESNPVVLKERDAIFLKAVDSVRTDTDADGIPDRWEQLFADDHSLAGFETDTDGDGYSDLTEMRWMSNPIEPKDVPAMASVRESEDENYYLLTWDAKLGRMYRVLQGDNAKPVGSYFEGFGEEITARIPKSSFTKKPNLSLGIVESDGDVNGLFWQKIAKISVTGDSSPDLSTAIDVNSSWFPTAEKNAIVYELDKQVLVRKVTVNMGAVSSALFDVKTSIDGIHWQTYNQLAVSDELSATMWLHEVDAKYVMLVNKLNNNIEVESVRIDGFFKR